MEQAQRQKIKRGLIVIALLLIIYFGTGAIFKFHTVVNNPLRKDGYYREYISIELDFGKKTSFVLYLPAIKVHGNITPVYLHPKDLSPDPADANLAMSWKTIGGNTYLELNGSLSSVTLSNKISLPTVRDNNLAYEPYLFAHDFSITNTTSIPLLKASRGVDLRYLFNADTNLCSILDSGLVFTGAQQLMPGMTVSAQDLSITSACL